MLYYTILNYIKLFKNIFFEFIIDTLNVLAFVTSGDIPSSRSGHTHVNIGKNVIGK